MYDLQLITIECSCPPILLYLHQQRIFFPNKHGLQSSVSHDCLVLLCRYLQVKKCWPRRFYRIAWWGITASDILWQTQRTSDVVLIINSRGKIHFPTIQKKSLKNSCLPRLLISIRAQALSGNIFWFAQHIADISWTQWLLQAEPQKFFMSDGALDLSSWPSSVWHCVDSNRRSKVRLFLANR